jgi:DNA polymerase iota
MAARVPPIPRNGDRLILHFDYDCYYASVLESQNPSLRSLPLAVQQKQIIVTCNYEARRRGLHKLQLVKDARRICPDVVIELGEDISRFRDASKELYSFLKAFSWNQKVERLGLDEVWMDCTDIVDYNLDLLNRNDLEHAFFHLSRDDPMNGFIFDATHIAGHSWPLGATYNACAEDGSRESMLRLHLASHLALHLRHQLELQKGYTSSVGIATSKLVAKLVGNLNKPQAQTTVLGNNVMKFMDGHEIEKVPGIGFKLAQKLRGFVLKDNNLICASTKESVQVSHVREHPDVNPAMLEKLLAGPGSPRGIGHKVWCLLHGVDDSQVGAARAVPTQISIEDSYIRLDTMPELLAQLKILSRSLLTRMRIDLLASEDDFDGGGGKDADQITKAPAALGRRWLAHPKTLRLTTRPREPLRPDGSRVRSFKRISHSTSLPSFVFNLTEPVEVLAEKLQEFLVGMFRRLHPEKAGWNLSLINLAVTNMLETASDNKTAKGRDIGNMFKRHDAVLKEFRVDDETAPPRATEERMEREDTLTDPKARIRLWGEAFEEDADADAGWNGDGDETEICGECGLKMPAFAMVAHQRYHKLIERGSSRSHSRSL